MVATARGTFDVAMQPEPQEAGGAVSRFGLVKTFHGDLLGSGAGVMLSAGDPSTGAAGYVAMEAVQGSLGGRIGAFVLQQYGTASAGTHTMHYEVVPGSGTGELTHLAGTVHLTVEQDGSHVYELIYEIEGYE